jgi:hypothetical protein
MSVMFGEKNSDTCDPNPLLYPLHLMMAGIFSLVLPFICWGALATPGHPHGLPHFVFLAPALVNAENTAEVHTEHDSHAPVPPESASDAAKPVARSVTPVLAVALLAPILLLLASLVAPALRHLVPRQGDATYVSLVLSPVPPPPRRSLTTFC